MTAMGTCGNCGDAKRIGGGSCWCLLFGIFIREDHECKYWKERVINGEDGQTGSGDDHQRGQDDDGSEIWEDGGGAAGEVPGVLPEPGE